MPNLRARTGERSAESLATQLRRAVIRSVLICTVIVLGVAGAAGLAELSRSGSPAEAPTGDVDRGANSDHLATKIARLNCSTTGYGAEVIPSSALIRTPPGHLRHVTFDRGWQIHTSPGAARLVAVCLSPAP